MKRQQVTSVRLGLLAAIFALALPGIALGQVAGTEGIKQGEKFAKAGGEVLSAVAEARRDIDATLTAYNTLVQKPTKDVKGDYKRLQKALEKANEASAKVKPRVDAMNVESEAYYKIWASQVANVQDADLRGRGEQRITASRDEQQHPVRDAGHRRGADTLRQDLTDQINFLGAISGRRPWPRSRTTRRSSTREEPQCSLARMMSSGPRTRSSRRCDRSRKTRAPHPGVRWGADARGASTTYSEPFPGG
jgi:hypothetical protein